MKKLLLLTITLLGAFILSGCEEGEKEMNNIEKATELINTFVSGDTEKAASLLKEDYIQHNLAYGTGRDAFVGAVEYLAALEVNTTVETVRGFEDGDYVVLHNIYNFAGAGDVVAFDIFRFEDGLIAEHWDNILAVQPLNPSGHSQTDGSLDFVEVEKTEDNKLFVQNFVKDVLMGENPDKVTDYISLETYTQHNPVIADGLDGLGAALEGMAAAGIEMIYSETHMVLGYGNFVLTVSEGTFADEATSYYDLFRVEDGKIVEHWDVMETIAPEDNWQNNNGKY